MQTKSLPKPKYCDQKWLNMQPTANGRICGQCSKTIVDFSKMNWSEIEKIQQTNDHTVCGMYSNNQLKKWGIAPPNKCSKFSTTTALLLSMTLALDTSAQTNRLETKTIIYGSIKSSENSDPLIFSNIFLKGTSRQVQSDADGNYELDITNYIDTLPNPTITFSYVGFKDLEIVLNIKQKGLIKCDALLSEDNVIQNFYVRKPTLFERIKWTFQKWFGK
jgi:hypothetical protein